MMATLYAERSVKIASGPSTRRWASRVSSSERERAFVVTLEGHHARQVVRGPQRDRVLRPEGVALDLHDLFKKPLGLLILPLG